MLGPDRLQLPSWMIVEIGVLGCDRSVGIWPTIRLFSSYLNLIREQIFEFLRLLMKNNMVFNRFCHLQAMCSKNQKMILKRCQQC